MPSSCVWIRVYWRWQRTLAEIREAFENAQVSENPRNTFLLEKFGYYEKAKDEVRIGIKLPVYNSLDVQSNDPATIHALLKRMKRAMIAELK